MRVRERLTKMKEAVTGAKTKVIATVTTAPALIIATTTSALAADSGTVDYGQKAAEAVNTAIAGVDFGVFFTIFAAVVAACIGVVVGIIALRKGINWLRGMISGV